MIKQKMINRLHRRNSSSSSAASIDYTSGERLQFSFSALHALQVPKGWDKLSLSLISVETGKTIAKTGRASPQNGNCQWTENLSEYIWVPHDDASKGLEQCLYKLLISMGSGRSGILGEITVNLAGHVSSETPLSIAQPLKNCSYGTILQVEIRCLTPRANLRNDRWTDTDSFTEDVNASDELDNTSDVSDSRITKSVGSSTSSNFMYTSQAGGLGNRDRSLSAGGSRGSFDSMDDSLGRESCSPRRNLTEAANDLIGRHNSLGSSNSAQYSSYHVHDSPRSTRSPYSSGSGKHILTQRQDPEKLSHSIPASPARSSGSTGSFLDSEGATVEELRAEARMWERNARKLKVDQDFLRKESRDQKRMLENATMEVIALQTECDGLKHEIDYLKVLLDESAMKETAADSLKLQVQDNIQNELEEEIKFQRELNDDLSLQLNKTQESNLELVSVLGELEEMIEKQRLEIESLSMLKQQLVDSGVKSQKTLESTILDLEKTLEEKTREIEHERILKAQTLSENESKLSLKDEEIFSLKAKLSEAHAAQVPKEIESQTPDLIEVEALRNKIHELERDCSELTEENLELLLKLRESNSFSGEGQVEVVNMELKSKMEDLGKELSAKTSEIEVLKSDCLLKDKEIQRQRCHQKDLETQLSDLQSLKKQLNGTLKAMQSESTIIFECVDKVKNDMVVLNNTKESQVAANKILEKKLLEAESCNNELEQHLAELEVENLHLSDRISGLETNLRYLTDAKESSRLETEHSETRVVNLQAEIQRLEEEIETSKVDMKQKLQEMQKRWLEAQEECEYLKRANPKLQTTAENLIEESSVLQKSNRELKQQRLELYNRCTFLEAELKESQHNFSKFSINLGDLEEKFSLMIEEIARKEKMFDSELEALHLKNEEYTEKLVIRENLFNQMYSEKVVEIENLQQEVAHLNTQIYASHDEREKMASEAVHEMHVLRADKEKLEKALEDITEKFRSSETKLDTVQVEYESTIQKLRVELSASKQNHGVLESNLEKLMELLENTRSNEEKSRLTVGELDGNLKHCEYQRVQLTEEISSLQSRLQKIPVLQDEVVALKKSLNSVKYENERLEASLQLITEDYEELKEEKISLFQRTSSMQKAVNELEDHKRTKVLLEEQVMRLQGDLTAREALSAQEAELKNELGRLKRSNSQLQRKISCLQEEKDACMKNAQVLEEKLEQKKGFSKADEIECSTNNSATSFRSDSMNSFHEYMKLSEDVEANTIDETTIDAMTRIHSLESELAEALEANNMYKAQIKSFMSEGETVNKEHDKDASVLETELKELQERYLHMSLKYAEVEAQREELVLKLKVVRPGKSWFS